MWMSHLRVKHIWDYIPLPRSLKLVCDRLTFSKLTIAYLLFSSIHCIIQVTLQSWAFQINANSASFMYTLAKEGNATDKRIPMLVDGKMFLCDDVPLRHPDEVCQLIWGVSEKEDVNAQGQSSVVDLGDGVATVASVVPASVGSYLSATATTSITPPAALETALDNDEYDGEDSDDEDDDDDIIIVATISKRWHPFDTEVVQVNGQTAINITGSNITGEKTLSRDCLWALNWPVAKLENTKREDIVFISFQIWVLGMSLAALLNESIPHIFASLLTHLLATAWSGFQINHTASFKKDFQEVISSGACGVNLLPSYWEGRANAEYATLALNVVALVVSGFLTWKLVKLFGWQTFKRVGASLSINSIYRLVLVLSILIQISVFFIAVTAGLWLDSLFNGVAAEFAWYVPLYKASIIAVLLLLVPWLMTGWFAIRRELRITMLLFLFLSILYLVGWCMMFLSDTFRWLFKDWIFFSLMATFSVALTVCAFALGVVCRLNFGKGLIRYLNAQEPLPGDDFAPVTEGSSDIEKVDFPSNQHAIPTFSTTFEVPVPAPMFSQPHRMGPRFFNSSAQPFDAQSNMTSVPRPPVARTLSRSPSGDSVTWSDGSHGAGIHRNPSISSNNSKSSSKHYYTSSDSGHSMSSTSSHHGMRGKNWSIE